MAQLKEKGLPANLLPPLRLRSKSDERDRSRAASPLVPAADAIVIDSTALSIEDVVETVLRNASKGVVSRNVIVVNLKGQGARHAGLSLLWKNPDWVRSPVGWSVMRGSGINTHV